MEIRTYDVGSAIVVEAKAYLYEPHDGAPLFDPDTIVITITDPDGTDKVDAVAMDNSDVGKYYYICQTATDWVKGFYQATFVATAGALSDVEVVDRVFLLE